MTQHMQSQEFRSLAAVTPDTEHWSAASPGDGDTLSTWESIGTAWRSQEQRFPISLWWLFHFARFLVLLPVLSYKKRNICIALLLAEDRRILAVCFLSWDQYFSANCLETILFFENPNSSSFTAVEIKGGSL